MLLTFHGHACFSINIGGKKILVDPWLDQNPLSDINAEEATADIILVTHGHYDHVGDAVVISKKTGAEIVAVSELARLLSYEGAKTRIMNIGGTLRWENLSITMTNALHSSSYTKEGVAYYAGVSCGYLIKWDDEVVYHAGDTSLFSDMSLLIRKAPISVALLPIGGMVTMDVNDAIDAAALLSPKIAIPMHYNSFPAILQDPAEFVQKASMRGIKAIVATPGEAIHI